MTKAEIKKHKAQAKTWLLYCLANHATAKENGSVQSAERNRQEAADWAAIYTALNGMKESWL